MGGGEAGRIFSIMATSVRTVRSGNVSSLGRLLRHWRSARGLSQMGLALRASISARHLSFVETGRAQAGRDVVLRLASALDLPLRDRNAALTAAGYAPVFRHGPLHTPEMEPVVRALDFMLRQQEPYPAMVVDRLCNILKMNDASARFLRLFLDPLPAGTLNIVRLLLEPGPLREAITNWKEVAERVIVRLRRDLLTGPSCPELGELLDDLSARVPELPSTGRAFAPEASAPPVVPTEFRLGDRTLRLFTTLTSFGSPQDVTLQELKIECSFPADPVTDAYLRAVAAA
jgi:transcriptional regulator with XRE-family HTH domain